MKTVKRYDSMYLVAGAVTTAEGYLLDSPVVARTGIYIYKLPDGKERREYRPPEEVFANDAMDSFKNKPITVLHPKGGKVTSENAHKLAIGVITSSAYRKGDTNLACDIVIHSPQEIKNYRELSVGYSVDLEETPGITPNGEHYDAIQHNIRCNHLAVVPSARAGRQARLNLDGDEIVEIEGEKMAKIRIDSKEFEVEESVAAHISALTMKADAAQAKCDTVTAERDKLKTDMADTTAKLDTMTAERDSLQAKVDAAEADKKQAVDKAVADAKKEVKERAELEETAKKAKVEKTDGLDNKALKVAVIKAVRGDSFNVEGKSDAYVDAAYDLVKEDMRNDSLANQMKNFKGIHGDAPVIKTDADEARQNMINRMMGKEDK